MHETRPIPTTVHIRKSGAPEALCRHSGKAFIEWYPGTPAPSVSCNRCAASAATIEAPEADFKDPEIERLIETIELVLNDLELCTKTDKHTTVAKARLRATLLALGRLRG